MYREYDHYFINLNKLIRFDIDNLEERKVNL